MNKNELQKIYQKIVLKTNGGIDDYVVALCQIGNAIGELDDQQQQIAELQKQLEEKEKIIEYWHNLYQERDKQFQSVRQRYHLLNRLQSNYNEKDKLHLSEMQCLELVEENENLKQQLQVQPAEIVEKIKEMLEGKELVADGLSCQYICYCKEDIDKIISTILKEYKK